MLLELRAGYIDIREWPDLENTSIPEISLKLEKRLSKKEERMLRFCMRSHSGYLKSAEEYVFPVYSLTIEESEKEEKEILKGIEKIKQFLKDPELVFQEEVKKRKEIVEKLNECAKKILEKIEGSVSIKEGTFEISECDVEITYPELRVFLNKKLTSEDTRILDRLLSTGRIVIRDENELDYVIFSIGSDILEEREKKNKEEMLKKELKIIEQYLKDKKKAISLYVENEKKKIEKLNEIAAKIFQNLIKKA